jgi:hypothetical protein
MSGHHNDRFKKAEHLMFDDTHLFKEDRFALGVEADSGRYYASIPVSNGLVDYEEYYELTPEQYQAFVVNHCAAVEFVQACRRHDHDELLMQKPGMNRGTPI